MGRLTLVVLALVASGSLATRAVASPTPAAGSLAIVIGTGLPIPITIPIAATVDVTGGTLTIPASIASATGLFVPVTGFPLNLITGVIVTVSNGAGLFASGAAAEGGPANVPGGGFGGKMSLSGIVQIKGSLAVNVPISVVGSGGSVSVGGVAVDGAPWTTGAGMVTIPGGGMFQYTQTGTRSGALGAASSTVTLVTPAYVDIGGGVRVPVFGTLSLHFVPEPGSLALLGVGLASLALAARRR